MRFHRPLLLWAITVLSLGSWITLTHDLVAGDRPPATPGPTGLLALGPEVPIVLERSADVRCNETVTASTALLDPATGAERWHLDLPRADRGPSIGHGLALVYDEGERLAPNLTAVDLATGAPRWQRFLPRRADVIDARSPEGIVLELRRPGPGGEHLVALDPATGAIRWTSPERSADGPATTRTVGELQRHDRRLARRDVAVRTATPPPLDHPSVHPDHVSETELTLPEGRLVTTIRRGPGCPCGND